MQGEGACVGVDCVPEFVDRAREIATDAGVDSGMEFICSDNIWKDAEYEDMFDAIYCAPALSGDMERDDVDLLLEMLRPGGRLVVPIENPVDGAQRLMIFDKDEAGLSILSTKGPPVACQRLSTREEAEEIARAEAKKIEDAKKKVSKEDAREALQGWREAFEARHGRSPNRQDMMSDAFASEMFNHFSNGS